MEYRQLDTLVVAGSRPGQAEADAGESLPLYQGSKRMNFDLLHTALDLHFDWEKENVIGTAILRLTPYFYPQEQIRLDASGMTIHSVGLESGRELAFAYEDPFLKVMFDKTYKAGEEISLIINYTAHPSASGGSRAITSDKGFYFIQAKDGKARQFWTQGETQANSKWFPTLDQPNERATQEIRLTVPDSMRTLSNGVLVSSRGNGNATRTDHWKLDLPHAPYLAMVAAGSFAVVEDSWNGLPLQYYVDPEYGEIARDIFPHTPEMLAFFSDYFQVGYPWPKYAQIVVRDFVSGAMENTTAVVFGDFMQPSGRVPLNSTGNEKVVAHELVHHWFGNLVTCESWANLTLNEGFANYGEYLWLEHFYGKATADLHMAGEWEGYFSEAGRRPRPLIQFAYKDAESLFDRHSYNKGGAVLHMLRQYLGDDAFRAGLALYLERHAYSSVEVHDLRLAFEEVCGEDLNWFFNQWFLQQGHPELEIAYRYDAKNREIAVEVNQLQDGGPTPRVFMLPTAIEIVNAAGETRRMEVVVNKRRQTFRFAEGQKPLSVQFDPDRVILAERQESEARP